MLTSLQVETQTDYDYGHANFNFYNVTEVTETGMHTYTVYEGRQTLDDCYKYKQYKKLELNIAETNKMKI